MEHSIEDDCVNDDWIRLIEWDYIIALILAFTVIDVRRR